MAKSDHYVNGNTTAPQEYELRINNQVVERSSSCVDLYWKARRAVNGNPGVIAQVEAVSGFYSDAFFTDANLADWESAA